MTTWNFRPTALSSMYKSASMTSLFDHYLSDGSAASRNGGSIPKNKSPPASSSGKVHAKGSSVRTCQWNIHYLKQDWLPGRNSVIQQAHRIADEVLKVNADIIILNEVGVMGSRDHCCQLDILCKRLEDKGYTILIAGCPFPTAIASRLPIIRKDCFRLDHTRSAVYMDVEVGGTHLEAETVKKERSEEATMGPHKTTITVFGTHLDHSRGESRLFEVKHLLSELEPIGCDNSDRVLIIGDLNQQRSCDYLEKEWEAICANKDLRNSPYDDGVSSELKNAGFECCYDQPLLRCNWNPENPPPATHWTSTIIDYAYSRGGIKCEAIYVSPNNHSDHRMIVIDWKVD